MDLTLEKLIGDLLNSKTDADTTEYITTYIKLIKIDDLNLSYVNFDDDIKIVVNKLINTYASIYKEYNKKLTATYRPFFNLFSITEKIVNFLSTTINNLNTNITYLENILKYFDIENQKFKLYKSNDVTEFIKLINLTKKIDTTLSKTKQEEQIEENKKIEENINFFSNYIKKM